MPTVRPLSFGVLLLAALVVWVSGASAADPASGQYDAATRTWTVSADGAPRFKYVFNKGGAVNGIFDLKLAPKRNLIGKSFQGETTDRVIQWTYWNGRYTVPKNDVGDKNLRANATMEGCFHEAATCDALREPESGPARSLTFVSRLRHWFYANLNVHGQPDFETTSTYELLEGGGLKLTRRVLRRPWILKNVYETTRGPDGKPVKTQHAEVEMRCEFRAPGSIDSYFEAWTPFNRVPLPLQKHAQGPLEKAGYVFLKPSTLGGWAMAYGETQAVAVVFGTTDQPASDLPLRVSFNALDLPKAELNILMPAIELDWPAHATLTQTLLIVPGSPAEAEATARQLAPTVPAPVLELRKKE